MRRITILTEQPEKELWEKILQYSYKARIQKYFAMNGIEPGEKSDMLSETIICSLLQANEYYRLSRDASLHTAPLLLYYGTINLFLGASTLLSGKDFSINGHGMKVNICKDVSEIGATTIHFVSPKDGGINVFAGQIESQDYSLMDLQTFSLREMLLSIPEINLEALQCYGESDNYCIPLETIRTEDGVIERVIFSGHDHKAIAAMLSRIPAFSTSYLNPSFVDRKDNTIVTLRHKYMQDPICYSSITEQSYLLIGHIHGEKLIVLPQWVYMYASLFGMATLCRYHPYLWNPFIRLDEKGERLLVEKFINIARRKLPNIILNRIENCEYSFENRKYVPENQVKVLGEHEVKDLVREEIIRKDMNR